MKISAAWIRKERGAHLRALAAPQAFALTGDGDLTRLAIKRDSNDPGAALAEARYRDWRWQHEQEEVARMLDQRKPE